MRIETEEAVAAIYLFIEHRHQSATFARNKCEPKSHQHLMLCGKVKAFTDVLSFIRSRYGSKMASHVADVVTKNYE